MGVPRQTVARPLNHPERDVRRVYDRYSYDREKREALAAWEDDLLRLISSKNPEEHEAA